MSAHEVFAKGDVVVPSRAGANLAGLGTVRRDMRGVVTGFSRDGRCVKVLWDGTKQPRPYHYTFVVHAPLSDPEGRE